MNLPHKHVGLADSCLQCLTPEKKNKTKQIGCFEVNIGLQKPQNIRRLSVLQSFTDPGSQSASGVSDSYLDRRSPERQGYQSACS